MILTSSCGSLREVCVYLSSDAESSPSPHTPGALRAAESSSGCASARSPASASRVAELVRLEALDHEPLTRAKLVVAVRHVRYARRRLTRKLQLRAAERELRAAERERGRR